MTLRALLFVTIILRLRKAVARRDTFGALQAHVRRVLLDSFADVGSLGRTFPALAALEVEDARFDAGDLAKLAALRHLRSLKLLVRPAAACACCLDTLSRAVHL